MTEKPRKSAEKPKAPEKDEHGCVIGQEYWDALRGRCVSITKPATVGTQTIHQKLAWESYQKRKKEKEFDEWLKKRGMKIREK